MESLSRFNVLSAPYLLQNHLKTPKFICLPKPNSAINDELTRPNQLHSPFTSGTRSLHFKNPPLLSLSLLNLLSGAFPCFAAETLLSPSPDPSTKINLEAILVSIDEFFNRNPFFVAGCTFVWLVVIPVADYYLKKYKYISAIDTFRKLREDPSAELLDIRDQKSLETMASPSLQYLKKTAVHVQFNEGDEEGFVKKVKESFRDQSNTVICILDNLDGNSMKVAELLFKSGFKEAYAIKGGVRGKKGWLAIQESLLPPSVHMKANKKGEASEDIGINGAVPEQNGQNDLISFLPDAPTKVEEQPNDALNSNKSTLIPDKVVHNSLSPYPNYADMKPPSSPTPSKPKN
ncbi:hypothetical protein SAY87_023479 [Trapa incisa]|uniref:Rhodanese-like domain-containing protein 4A, chloroplastic n=1 Tax=Trapa incisa TaxID=236973 RepID=A0AAN7QU65_9MYRT|nr:hypothetical protein SAY87_023479 [Trapa incisa]